MFVDKEEFAHDVVVVVACTRKAAEEAERAYLRVTRILGLTVSLPKANFMVVGCGVTDDDRLPLPLEDGGNSGMCESVSLLGLLNS